MKKTLSLLLSALIIILSVSVCVPAQAAEGEFGDDLYWDYEESTKTLSITGYGSMPNLSDGKQPWYKYDVEHVVIGEHIEYIGRYNFANMTSIKDVKCLGVIHGIASYAFLGCSNLNLFKSKTPGEDMYMWDIGGDAFKDCTSLESLDFLNTSKVLTISGYAFSGCTSIKSLKIPDCVEEVYAWAFKDCTSLEEVCIGSEVSILKQDVFEGCTSIKKYEVSKENTTLSSIDGVLYNKDQTSLWSYPSAASATHFDVPDGVTTIKPHAFSNVEALEEISLPASLSLISLNAFQKCPNLTKVNYSSTKADWNQLVTIKDGNDVITNAEIEYLHIWDDGTVKKEATCSALGVMAYTCTDCLKLRLEPIPIDPENHDYTGEVVLEPTCASNGLTLYTCSRCKGTKTEIIPATQNHNYTVEDIVKMPTCNETGIKNIKCETCDKIITEEIPASGEHSYTVEKVLKAATCSEMGLRAYCCETCDKYITESIPCEEHEYTEKNTIQERSCINDEIIQTLCSECGYSYLTIEKTTNDHQYKLNSTIPATFTLDGKKIFVCSECSNSKIENISKLSQVKLSKTTYQYDGKVKTPNISVTDSQGNPVSSKYYSVSYVGNRKSVGKQQIVVKFKNGYSGTKTLTFKILPKSTKISKLVSTKAGFKISWNKQTTQTTGYQIQYSTSSKFTKKTTKNVTVPKNSTTSKTVSKLKGNKKYYVRVRTYKTVDNQKYYSSWSAVKTITTKK